MRELAQAGYRVLGIGISEAVISTVHKGAREGCPRPSSGSPRCSRRRSSRARPSHPLRPSRPSARSSITSSIHATTSRRWHVSFSACTFACTFACTRLSFQGASSSSTSRSQGGAGAELGQTRQGTAIQELTEGEDWVVLYEKEEDGGTLIRRIHHLPEGRRALKMLGRDAPPEALPCARRRQEAAPGGLQGAAADPRLRPLPSAASPRNVHRAQTGVR
jgi:hypothetical protein